MESAANAGGTKMIDTSAPVFSTASFTVLKTGRNITDTFIPLRDALAEAVKKAGTLNIKKDERLKDLRGALLKPAA